MLGSNVLDIAIGLAFIYALMSLAASALQELIAAALRLRAKTLADGVANLLRDDEMTQKVYEHGLVASLALAGQKPSYIPSRSFALALLDAFAPANNNSVRTVEELRKGLGSLPDGQLKQALSSLLEESDANTEEFKRNVEIWFNNAMDRVSGWYKRRTQLILLAIAVITARGLTVDSVRIARTLARDSVLRASLVAQAEQFGRAPSPPNTSGTNGATGLQAVQEQAANLVRQVGTVAGMGVPLSWSREMRTDDGLGIAAHVAGWVLSALAISLGAPFWFDLLNKFMTIRGAGKAPEEKPKPPKKIPQPQEPGKAS
jgi:hypothetical protein